MEDLVYVLFHFQEFSQYAEDYSITYKEPLKHTKCISTESNVTPITSQYKSNFL